MAKNSLQLIVRGHECVSLGFAFNSAGRVMTLFSAINYCGSCPFFPFTSFFFSSFTAGDSQNAGAILDIAEDLMCMTKIVRHVEDPDREMLVVKREVEPRKSCFFVLAS
jgi:protein phosphatase